MEISNVLMEISNEFTIHLAKSDYDTKKIDERVPRVFNFIYVFPLIYVLSTIYHVGMYTSKWIASFTVLFTEFILISLFNIQDQIEYPFDRVGMDDIELETFKLDR